MATLVLFGVLVVGAAFFGLCGWYGLTTQRDQYVFGSAMLLIVGIVSGLGALAVGIELVNSVVGLLQGETSA